MSPKLDWVRAWLAKARNDLTLVGHALSGEPPVFDGACFHAQQAVEKSLKALLVNRDVDPPRTHLLERLLELCEPLDPALQALREEMIWLSTFAVETRYPNPDMEPGRDDGERALGIAQRAMAAVLALLPPESHP